MKKSGIRAIVLPGAIFLVAAFYALLNAQSAAPAHSVRDGIYTEAQAVRGEALYDKHCERCHGGDLEGDEGPSLNSEDFLEDWKGLTVGDLFERIRIWMPGDRPGILTRQETADVLALVLRANHFPPGLRELGTDKQVLAGFRVESRR